jgi:hypothetical protein
MNFIEDCDEECDDEECDEECNEEDIWNNGQNDDYDLEDELAEDYDNEEEETDDGWSDEEFDHLEALADIAAEAYQHLYDYDDYAPAPALAPEVYYLYEGM